MLKHIYRIVFLLGLISLTGCSSDRISTNPLDYSTDTFWAYLPDGNTGTDVFFVAPTVFFGDAENMNMDVNDSLSRVSFLGAINMEKGIYEFAENFYAPFYRQTSLYCYLQRGKKYSSDNQNVEKAFNKAYSDVEASFEYYLSQSDRPFILAGFSQGSEILIELIKRKLTTQSLQERHIATYAIGWRLLEKDVKDYPQLQNALAEDDLGVVITFSSEAEFIESSIIAPHKTLSINPLNWTTDTTFADREYNLGACFTNYEGKIVTEIDHFTGAYICENRGTLKAPDVNPDEYLPKLSLMEKGEYHIYDYMFFYRNLQENVRTRILKYNEMKER